MALALSPYAYNYRTIHFAVFSVIYVYDYAEAAQEAIKTQRIPTRDNNDKAMQQKRS